VLAIFFLSSHSHGCQNWLGNYFLRKENFWSGGQNCLRSYCQQKKYKIVKINQKFEVKNKWRKLLEGCSCSSINALCCFFTINFFFLWWWLLGNYFIFLRKGIFICPFQLIETIKLLGNYLCTIRSKTGRTRVFFSCKQLETFYWRIATAGIYNIY
jgi:hypothetical protein